MHEGEDHNTKEDVSGFQAAWLAEVGEAVAAGFKPQPDDPKDREYIDAAGHDALWAEAV